METPPPISEMNEAQMLDWVMRLRVRREALRDAAITAKAKGKRIPKESKPRALKKGAWDDDPIMKAMLEGGDEE